MKFYKFKNSLITKEIGKYPQSKSVNKWGDLDTVPYTGRKQPITEIWDIPEPIMQKKAKPSTLLHVIPFSNGIFLVLKKHFISFLKEFNVDHFNSWELKVHHKKEILTDYRLFHLSYPSDEECIDFKKSEFLIGKSEDWKDPSVRKPIKVDSYRNYLNLLEVLKESGDDAEIRCNKLILDFSDTNKDLIRLTDNPVDIGYYISERLKKAIEAERFTGMEFVEIDKIDKRIEVIY